MKSTSFRDHDADCRFRSSFTSLLPPKFMAMALNRFRVMDVVGLAHPKTQHDYNSADFCSNIIDSLYYRCAAPFDFMTCYN